MAASRCALRASKLPVDVRLNCCGAGQRARADRGGGGRVASLCRNRMHGDRRLANIGMEFVLGANAQLTHVAHRAEAADAVQVDDIARHGCARARVYRAHFANFGARAFARSNCRSRWKARARRRISPASACWPTARMPTSRRISFTPSATRTSTQLFKNVAGGKSRAVYQGKVTVAKGAERLRQPPDRQGAAAGRARRSRSEAGTRNLRRRCEMRPWRGGRRSRCGFAVLSARPRHSGSRGAQPADPRFPGRRRSTKSRTKTSAPTSGRRSKTRCASWRRVMNAPAEDQRRVRS